MIYTHKLCIILKIQTDPLPDYWGYQYCLIGKELFNLNILDENKRADHVGSNEDKEIKSYLSDELRKNEEI